MIDRNGAAQRACRSDRRSRTLTSTEMERSRLKPADERLGEPRSRSRPRPGEGAVSTVRMAGVGLCRPFGFRCSVFGVRIGGLDNDGVLHARVCERHEQAVQDDGARCGDISPAS